MKVIPRSALTYLRNEKRSGFTLVELLSVIAIIAVLAGILLPSIGYVRSSARNSKCVSNMRQQYMTAMSYVSDKGVLPRAVDSGTYWFRELAPYLDYDPAKTGKDYSLFMCPERPVDRLQEIVSEQGGSISYGGYLTNPIVCGIPPNSLPVKKPAQFTDATNTWMIADGNGQAAAYIWDDRSIEERIAYDHKVGGEMVANIIMLDGRATSKTLEEMLENEGNFWRDLRISD